MANCQAGPKRCHIECKHGCGCIYVDDACTCECYDDAGGSSDQRYNLGSMVSISVAGLPLKQVAGMLDRLLVREVLVPVSRADKRVNLRVKRASFSAVLRALGLSTRAPEKTNRRSRR